MRPDDPNWLDKVLPLQEQLTGSVRQILENILSAKGIDFFEIQTRTKSRLDCDKKIKRKGYKDPAAELTDISGIRVIVYLESEVEHVSEIIESTFEIDEENSADISEVLGQDRIGYRSVHFVGSLNKTRTKLPDYERFKDLTFEIQIRTVLQHAWATLSHDRSYRFAGGLPTEIQRKLNLYAGMLELVDGGFDDIAEAVGEYEENLTKLREPQLEEFDINSLSIRNALDRVAKKHKLEIVEGHISDKGVGEIKRFGISNIKEFNELFTPDFIKLVRKLEGMRSYIGLVRSALVFADIDRYFEKAFKGEWKVWDYPSWKLFSQHFGQDKIDEIVSTYKLTVDEGDSDD